MTGSQCRCCSTAGESLKLIADGPKATFANEFGSLKSLNVAFWRTTEYRVGVVETPLNKSTGHGCSSVGVIGETDVSQCSNVIECGPTNFSHVLVHSDTEHHHVICLWNDRMEGE